jgi:hypothetical protein
LTLYLRLPRRTTLYLPLRVYGTLGFGMTVLGVEILLRLHDGKWRQAWGITEPTELKLQARRATPAIMQQTMYLKAVAYYNDSC